MRDVKYFLGQKKRQENCKKKKEKDEENMLKLLEMQGNPIITIVYISILDIYLVCLKKKL